MVDDRTREAPTPTPEGNRSGTGSLVLIYGGELGRRYEVYGELTIGRDSTCSIVIDAANVSRRHAVVLQLDEQFLVQDLGSTNGTFVNGEEIHGTRPLANGDLINLGGTIFKFLEGGNAESLYHEEIYRLTILDGLTGVHNKRYLLEYLDREVARSTRHDRPLCLAMVDVDHFKKVNDTYGHLAGDQILTELASMIQKEIRQEELVARYGGEEFAVVLPETDLPGAKALCERIRHEVEDRSFTFDETLIKVTISVGVAPVRTGISSLELIALADQNLYRAKNGGRNQIVADADDQ